MRIELRGSRWLATSLALLGALGAAGLFLTDLPTLGAVALAPVCAGWGAVLGRAELRRAPTLLELAAGGAAALDGVVVEDFDVDWRGALACLSWRIGERRMRRVVWPDVMGGTERRDLRLWVVEHRAPAVTASVAP